VGEVEATASTLGAAGTATQAQSPSRLPFQFLWAFLTRLSDSSDTPAAAAKKKKTKVGRKWGDEVPTEGDMASLDYSSDKPDGNNLISHSKVDVSALVDRASFGTRTADGMYEVKDWEFGDKGGKGDEIDRVISQALDSVSLKEQGQASAGTFGSSFGSLFARLTGSKTLTEEDLKSVLEGMKQHLMKKNVAKEIAEKVCEGVGESLVGQKVGGFQSTLPTPLVSGFTELMIRHSYECCLPLCSGSIYHAYPHPQDLHRPLAFYPYETFFAVALHPTEDAIQHHVCRR